ncbi:MAG TPA: efflux RND transporter permease subunit [Gemmatimonadaceae bacterium]
MIRWAVSRPAVIWAATVSLLLAGIVSFTRLALARSTNVELPRLTVTSSWPGASAELVEMYVASPIESAVQSVRGVRRTESRSTEGSASITVQLEPTADVQMTRLAILERTEMLRPEFPPGVTRPAVSNYVPEELQQEPLITATLTGPYTPGALVKLGEEVLTPRLTAVTGVAGVRVFGGAEISVVVSYSPTLLRQIDVSPEALSRAIGEARYVRSIGAEQRGFTEFEVTVRDQPDAVEQLAQLPIRGRGDRVFRLGEIATVYPQEDSYGRFSRINGQPSITLSIDRLPQADAIKTAAALRAAMEEVEATLPPGVELNIVHDDSESLKDQLRELLLRGAVAFAVVVLVLAVMLRDARAVALVMGSAAISIAGTAFGLYVFEIPANLLTLAGLSMGIGVLVQNGLVVAERLGTVAPTRERRAQVAERITPAIMGATLTTAVVLFPFLYLQGNARAAFVPFAVAFLMALGWSVVASVVMIPALATGTHIKEASWPRFRRLYTRIVYLAVKWRVVTLTLTVAALAGLGWVFVKKIPRFAFGGWGGDQRTTLMAYISFPRGSDPEALDAAIREFEDIVVGQTGVERVETRGDERAARMLVTFTREHELTAIPLEMEERLTQRGVLIGGASISVRGQGPGFSSGYGGGGMASYRIRVLGYSFAGVERLALDLKERLERIPRVRNVTTHSTSFFGSEKAFEITVEPDRDALARFGLTARDLTRAVGREVRGQMNSQLLEIGGEELRVDVKAEGARYRSVDELRDALIPTPNGSVPIRAVSTLDEREALSTIERRDQQYVRIVAYEFRGPNRLAQRTHDAFMASVVTPPGYKVEEAGYGWEPDRSEQGLWLVFSIGVILVLLSVALVFDSVWAATIIFLSLPVALGGVIFGFWMLDAAFTREAAVGVILVVGLAVNQAILVTDAALHRRRFNETRGTPGLGRMEVVRSAVDRAGMVILVTLTSLGSLLPLAIGTPTTSLFGAIALATAGGTLFGTIGALFIVPAMLAGRRRRKQKPDALPAPEGAVAPA